MCASALVLAAVASEEPAVAATGSANATDLDLDGLSDVHELVLGMQPNSSDPDGDGYSDLEEFARGSDPNSAASIPPASDFAMNMGACQVDGEVRMLASIYSDQSKAGFLRLELGIVYQGQVFRIYPRSFGAPRGFRSQPRDAGDRLTVVEFPMPVALVRRVGQVNVSAVLRDTSPGATEPVVSLLPLVNFSGITMSVEHTPATLNIGSGRPAGIVYRPLAGSSQLPSTWNGGEICFQRTAAVGMNGVSIVFEVEAAGCVPMDTYCSPTNCAAGVGRSIDLPDPASVAGG